MGAEPKPRILMTADAVGGIWQYALDLSRALLDRNFELVLAVMGPAPSVQQLAEAAGVPGLTLQQRPFALEWMQNPWPDVDCAGQWLLDLATAFEPEIVHLNGFSHAALPFRCPVVLVAHSCVYTWWQAVHNERPGPEWLYYRERITAGLRRAAALVAPTRAFARAIEEEYALDSGSVYNIPNFSAKNVSGPQGARQDFCLASGRLWDKAKNVSLLADIAPYLSWPVYVAGSTSGPDRAVAERPGLHHLGPLPHDEFLRYAEMAEIFVHPAFYEPFGLAVLESAARGCCLVLSAVDSLRELWEGAAVLLPPNDHRLWREALNGLIANPVERSRLAQEARSRASHFSAARTAEAYCKLYRMCTESKEALAS